MVKLFSFWTRGVDLTRDEALRQSDAHAPAYAAALGPSVVRFATNTGIPTEEAPPFDGVTEYWISDGAPSSAMDDLVAARPPFIGSRQLMVAEAVVHVDRGRRHAGVKSMFLLTRRPEMTRQQCVAYWRDHHVPLVTKTLGSHLVRYTTNVGLPMDLNGWPDESAPFDGVAELWLDLDTEAMHDFVGGAADTLLPDERAFLGTYRVYLSDERTHRGRDDAPLPS